jgi:capsular polysaccharide biosynthesis protein
MGILAGLAIGLGLAALLEYRDTTLRTDDDVLVTLAVPVLAMVPEIVTPAERVRARKRKLMLSAAAVTAGLVLAVVLVWRLGLLTGRV